MFLHVDERVIVDVAMEVNVRSTTVRTSALLSQKIPVGRLTLHANTTGIFVAVGDGKRTMFGSAIYSGELWYVVSLPRS